MYIYCITNNLTGKQYVGKRAETPEKSTSYYGSGIYIKSSINKHGIENFTKEILENDINDKTILNEREQYWIIELNSKYPNGYNLTNGGDGCQGMTEETKNKIREKNKLLVGELNSRYGMKNSEEHNEKIRQWNLNKVVSDETKERIRISKIGYKPTPETIKKMIQSNIGRNHSEDWCRKIRENQPNAIKVSQFTKDDEFIQSFPSTSEAERQTGVFKGSITKVCRGEAKTAGKFIWKFTEEMQ